jgi:hypothetical protein
MGEINLCNSSGRDAVVSTSSVTSLRQIRWLDDQGRQATLARVIKSTLQHDLAAILAANQCVLEDVSQLLIDGDPEIDLNNTGRILSDTSRIFIDRQQSIVRNVRFWEVIKNADGSVRERRPRQLAATNITGDTALRWSGIYIPKAQAVRKFVFSSKAQLVHINGLTYDFLFGMAKELEQRQSLMLLGAGPKSNQPLILRRGGTPYRGFLEGRTEGERYCLLLHFSNQELKRPSLSEPTESADSAAAANPADPATQSSLKGQEGE